jgi:hypothetical protein
VPERATVCGLFVAVSETVSVAARDPLTLGLNETEIVQVAEAARLVPQDFPEMTKSPGFVPVTAMLLMVIDELVPLVNVAVCAALVEPTFTEPNENEVGLMVTDPLEPPGAKPESATLCGEFDAVSIKVSEAVLVPPVVGANATFAEQLAPAASAEVQVFE